MKQVFSLQQIIAQLNSGTTWSTSSLTYSFPTALSLDNAQFNGSGFSAFNAGQQAAAVAALREFSDVTLLNPFTLASENSGDLRFHNLSNDGRYAFAYYPGSGQGGDVFTNSNYNSGNNDLVHPVRGTHGYATYLHEIGHAMGLDHPGNYGANPTYGADAVYFQDSAQYTVMSYFAAANTGADHIYDPVDAFNPIEAETLLIHDIAALGAMYGADTATRNGTTVYGFNSTLGTSVFNFALNLDPIVCIWDGGGNDTLDFSGFVRNAVLDLNAGAFSNTDFLTKNVSIAYGTVIENGTGGHGSDIIRGNSVANVLKGGDGSDFIGGGKGNDTLFGGNNVANGIRYGSGAASDSTAANGSRATALNLSASFSAAANADITNATTVPHVTVSATVIAGTRDYYRVQVNNVGAVITLDIDHGVKGPSPISQINFIDTKISLLDAAGTVLKFAESAEYAVTGDDIGSDFNNDPSLAYSVVTGGTFYVLVEYFGGTAYPQSQAGGTYQLHVSVAGEINPEEILDGGAGNDVLKGEAGNDILRGGTGVDDLDGGAGDDLLDGGADMDTLRGGDGNDSYILSDGNDSIFDSSGVDTISSTISRSVSQYTSIEHLTLIGTAAINGSGNDFANRLTGNASANTLSAGAGDDVLVGGGGRDDMYGGAGNDWFRFVAASDSVVGANRDVIRDFDDAGNDAIDVRSMGHFEFIGTNNFSADHQIRAVVAGGSIIIELNTVGTSGAEMEILLLKTSLASVTASDFIM
ncbi:MAG: hypothetical protein JWR75_839 [Devosia sp.]|nr:hypothetical protein [Devosia sp.]